MQTATGRTQTRSYQAAVVFMLALGAAVAAVVAPAARAGQQQQAGYGKTTGLVGIAQGQTARLTVWNKGDETVLTRLQFVNEQGKVEFLCNAVIPPGKAAVEEWPCCGGNADPQIPDGTSRVELQAQYGTNEKRSIGLLVPTLQVIDKATSANSWVIGQEGFAEFRPIFVPALVEPW